MIAAHIAVNQTAAVQNSAELHCASAPVHLNAPIRFLVQFHFAMTGVFVAASKLGCYNMMLCPRLKSSYKETSQYGSES